LLHPDAGTARIAGLDCWQQSVEIKRLVGYLPGELSLDPGLTGAQILEYFGHLRGGVDQAYLKQLVERFDLDTSRKFRQYSSGNKRKVGLIQAFMHRPRLLVRHEVAITFADTVPAAAFQKIEGVERVEELPDGRTLRLTIQGGLDAVVKAAAMYPVVSLTSHEPSLDEVFLTYYENGGKGPLEV